MEIFTAAMISSTGSAVLIDYGDVGDGPASLDSVTLATFCYCQPFHVPSRLC